MERLSWMKKVDTDMSRRDLLELIDHMHGVIDALLAENKEKSILIQKLKGAANE
ncbi:hypothetical protein [Alkaliphilus crotonatoxidans]